MNAAHRLHVACAIAPRLRANYERASRRRVAVVDRRDRLIGYTTLADVQRDVLAAAELAIQMAEGVRPTETFCEECFALCRVPPTGRLPKKCGPCAAGAVGRVCAGATNRYGIFIPCDATAPWWEREPFWRCNHCRGMHLLGSLTEEQAADLALSFKLFQRANEAVKRGTSRRRSQPHEFRGAGEPGEKGPL